VATVAAAAEESGWDGLFVWDHVHYRAYSGRPFGDAWMLLTAATLATSRSRVGTLLTPVARYRPQQLARQLATLDNLSKGRVVFAAGLGGPVVPHPVPLRAHVADAQARHVSLQPATVQRPRLRGHRTREHPRRRA